MSKIAIAWIYMLTWFALMIAAITVAVVYESWISLPVMIIVLTMTLYIPALDEWIHGGNRQDHV